MKVGQIVRIKSPEHMRDSLMIITGLSETGCKGRLSNGTLHRTLLENVTATRNVESKVREGFTNLYEIEKEIIKKQEAVARIHNEIKELQDKQVKIATKLSADLANSQGLCTKEELTEICSKKFSYLLDKGYEIYVAGTRVCFTYRKDIQKYFTSASFLYTEYDGTIAFESNCKTNKEYQGYLKQYRNQISKCKLPFEEYLELGDKYWLEYHSSYALKFKDLKKETVKKTLDRY